MSSIILLGFALLFLNVGHNTLLHFYVLDKKRQPFPAREILLPWPSRGKFVSILSGVLGGLFLWAWIAIPASRIDLREPRHLVLALAFVAMPLSLMVSFYWRRIKRNAAGPMMYNPTDLSPFELSVPSIVTAALTGGAMLWQWMRT